MKKTIIQLFNESVEKYADNVFLWEKKTDKFEPTTYSETKKKVHRLAAGLIAIGVERETKVAFLAEGRNDWIIGELAVLHTGAVNVPLSVKLEDGKDLIFRIEHSDSEFVIVSGAQLPKIRNIIKEVPKVKKIVVMDPQADLRENEISWDGLLETGDKLLAEDPQRVEKTAVYVLDTDYANISYTSGTTADPKGILLTHRNYTANVEQALTLVDVPVSYKTLIILPLDHCFAHVVGFYAFMASGASVATVQQGKNAIETLKNVPVNIKEVQPSILLSVPALAKSFKKNIESGIKAKGDFMWKMFNNALEMSYAYNKEGFNKGGIGQAWKKPLLALYDKILFSKIRQVFGGKLEFFIGGGALLDVNLQKFYYALGVPMFQGYGLSEATPVISSNTPKKHKLGSSGILVKPIDLKICDLDGKELPVGEKGEIVIRGENVMAGYWKNPEATAETIRDGWLFTGDMGYMDKDGFLFVTGRFKSLLIAGDGEKYSPEGIEEELVFSSPYIDQIMLHNNQNPYTVALIAPNLPAMKEFVKKQNLDWNSKEGKVCAIELIQNEINHFKQGGKFAGMFPDRWLPATFALLEEPFTEQNHLMNSTMKIVRGKITERYAARIEYLYTPEGKIILNELNEKALGE